MLSADEYSVGTLGAGGGGGGVGVAVFVGVGVGVGVGVADFDGVDTADGVVTAAVVSAAVSFLEPPAQDARMIRTMMPASHHLFFLNHGRGAFLGTGDDITVPHIFL